MDVLVIAAHPDDAEIGLGGTIGRWTDQGLAVGIVDITDGEPTPHGTREERLAEAQRAAEVLGVRERILSDFPNRYLMDTVELRQVVAEVMRVHRPRLVFGPLGLDQHPDHVAAAAVVRHARFYSKLSKTDMAGQPYYPPALLQFGTSHLRKVFQPAAVVDISSVFERKVEAVLTYSTQFSGREERVRDTLAATARFYGLRIGVRYGEPIFSPEELAIWDPAALLPG
ncbi:MAG: bacillithiol biosynthesis deacetylase BshB1 [Candidatus Bipolaricaulota bacterium]